jgi:hypothetical protein
VPILDCSASTSFTALESNAAKAEYDRLAALDA